MTDSTSFFADSGAPRAVAQAVSDDPPGTTSPAWSPASRPNSYMNEP